MIVRSVKFFWSLLVFAAVMWFVFFVELGERTLFQHIMRIAQTDEAQDLGREVHEASRRVSEEVQRTVEETEAERQAREEQAAREAPADNPAHSASRSAQEP